MPADINSDGSVDAFDLSILLSDWNSAATRSDLNTDGMVDSFDLSILLSEWGAVASGANPLLANRESCLIFDPSYVSSTTEVYDLQQQTTGLMKNGVSYVADPDFTSMSNWSGLGGEVATLPGTSEEWNSRINNQVTLVAVARWDRTANLGARLLSRAYGTASGEQQYELGVRSGSGHGFRSRVKVGTTTLEISDWNESSELLQDEPFLAAVVYDGTQSRLYSAKESDGWSLELLGLANATGSIADGTTAPVVGNVYDGASNADNVWTGQIGMTAIWSRALTEEELQLIANDPLDTMQDSYTPPPAPSGQVNGFTLDQQTYNSATFSWQELADATSYDIEVVGNQTVTGISSFSQIITDLSPETTYDVRIRGVNIGGAGPWSTPIQVTTEALNAPTVAPTLALTSKTDTAVFLSCSSVPNAETYEFQRDSSTIQATATTDMYDTNLTASTSYTYRVRGVNLAGPGPWSSDLIVTTDDAVAVPADWQTAWDTNDYNTIRNWYLANTGIAGAGLTEADLTPSGTVSSTHEGQVIELLNVTGGVSVKHDNVTVRNCKITGSSIGVDVPYSSRNDVSNFYVEYCTIVGDGSGGGSERTPERAIGGTYATLHAHHVYAEGRTGGYRLGNYEGDELAYSMIENIRTFDGSHNTGVSFRGGRFKTITHNWIEGSSSSGISLYPDALIQDVDCHFCLFDKGNYHVRGGDGAKAYADQMERIKFTDNKHTRDYNFGTLAAWSPHESNEWLRNVFLDDGSPA